ncbi:hypothetical protein M9980_12990 [Sphingomonas donggukensis]|uniref:Transmembrane protein n=1 Tax=Sphingomonas donggukensis TaxID=2949093 RepID=A0ABY4TSQ0_9SPHN|nr:hypothetical protein [Sphingomonas donggukensis]URW75435.1 hypothetical protein M9980_12990 [Sphingomonas donggukensis]
MDSNEARTALLGVDAARARLAQVSDCPPWRHAAFGGIMALFVGGVTLPAPWPMAATVVGLVAVAIVAHGDRRRTGMFVNGYRRGATLGVTAALLAVLFVLVAIGLRLRIDDGATLAKVALAAATFAIATGFSVVWQRVYVRELTGTAA